MLAQSDDVIVTVVWSAMSQLTDALACTRCTVIHCVISLPCWFISLTTPYNCVWLIDWLVGGWMYGWIDQSIDQSIDRWSWLSDSLILLMIHTFIHHLKIVTAAIGLLVLCIFQVITCMLIFYLLVIAVIASNRQILKIYDDFIWRHLLKSTVLKGCNKRTFRT